MDSGSWEVLLLVDSLNKPLESLEQSLCADEGRLEINGIGELVDYLMLAAESSDCWDGAHLTYYT